MTRDEERHTAEFSSQGYVLLRQLLEQSVVQEFQDIARTAHWIVRDQGMSVTRTLNPAKHGSVTSRLCVYFSQAGLLKPLSAIVQADLLGFVGNITRTIPGQTHGWQSPTFSYAMVLNLSDKPLSSWGAAAGDAILLDCRHNRIHALASAQDELTVVDGYFIDALVSHS